MFSEDRTWVYQAALLLFVLAFILVLWISKAFAVECPAGVPSCKVLIITPDEEKILTMPNGILLTAAQARSLDLAQTVQYFLTKIQTAPQGEVKPVEKAIPPGEKEISPLRKK